MKNMMPAGRPKAGPMRPLVCHWSDLDFGRGARDAQGFRTMFDRWRVEHMEQDRSFRTRVLHAAGLMD